MLLVFFYFYFCSNVFFDCAIYILCRLLCDNNDVSCKSTNIHCNYNGGGSYVDSCVMDFDTSTKEWQCGDRTKCYNTVSPVPEPSAAPGVRFSATAQFSSDFLEIYVSVEIGKYGNYLISAISNISDGNCSKIFDEATVLLLSEYSECTWDYETQTITIILSSHSTININDSLIINVNSLIHEDLSGYGINTKEITIDTITVNETRAVVPEISLHNFRDVIGLCDDLVLDARNSFHLGSHHSPHVFLSLCLSCRLFLLYQE